MITTEYILEKIEELIETPTKLRIISQGITKVVNPDESSVSNLNIIFNEIPKDNQEWEIYLSIWESLIKNLNQCIEDEIWGDLKDTDLDRIPRINLSGSIDEGEHYLFNDRGNTLQVSWNDNTLIVVIINTGQW